MLKKFAVGLLCSVLFACGGESEPQVPDVASPVAVVTPTQTLNNVAYSAVQGLEFRLPDATYAYGADPLQYGALWVPVDSSRSTPVVIFIHGGCWLNAFDIEHTYAVSTALAEAGIAVWSLEYRRTGDLGGGWPGTFEDILKGIDYLSQISDFNLDLSRIALAGHSAGGHLALLASSQALMVDISQTFGLAAIVDISEYARGDNSCQTATPRFMGGTPDELPQAYQAANPVNQTSTIDILLLQGGEDSIVPITQATESGVGQVELVPAAGHFDWIHPQTPAFERFLEKLQQVLMP